MNRAVAVAVMAGLLALVAAPIATTAASTGVLTAVAATGQVNYFNVSSGACTATVWTGLTLSDGNPPGMFPNNVGGPPITAVVGVGQICIQVVLSNAAANTKYVITGTKLSGELSVTTDSSGNGNNETVFYSSYDTTCTTDPLKINPTTDYSLSGGQINHVWVGIDCGKITTSSTESVGVPQFPAPMGIGFAMLIMVTVPLLYLMARTRKSSGIV